MDLEKTPFDKPYKFVKLFDSEKQSEIANIVNRVKENATNNSVINISIIID